MSIFLSALGMKAWLANSVTDYINLAGQHSASLDSLATIRQRLRQTAVCVTKRHSRSVSGKWSNKASDNKNTYLKSWKCSVE